MSDEEILKQIAESKADQRLREHINEGKELGTSEEDAQALKRYNAMSESEQANFKNKGWKNG